MQCLFFTENGNFEYCVKNIKIFPYKERNRNALTQYLTHGKWYVTATDGFLYVLYDIAPKALKFFPIGKEIEMLWRNIWLMVCDM